MWPSSVNARAERSAACRFTTGPRCTAISATLAPVMACTSPARVAGTCSGWGWSGASSPAAGVEWMGGPRPRRRDSESDRRVTDGEGTEGRSSSPGTSPCQSGRSSDRSRPVALASREEKMGGGNSSTTGSNDGATSFGADTGEGDCCEIGSGIASGRGPGMTRGCGRDGGDIRRSRVIRTSSGGRTVRINGVVLTGRGRTCRTGA
jgi:hypothetical protein